MYSVTKPCSRPFFVCLFVFKSHLPEVQTSFTFTFVFSNAMLWWQTSSLAMLWRQAHKQKHFLITHRLHKAPWKRRNKSRLFTGLFNQKLKSTPWPNTRTCCWFAFCGWLALRSLWLLMFRFVLYLFVQGICCRRTYRSVFSSPIRRSPFFSNAQSPQSASGVLN